MWKIPVLFEDEFILAVNKPAGLPTQAGQDPRRDNLYSLVQKERNEKLYLHHRLDKDTPGVLILGRHPKANKGLTDLFREHQLTKTYWALSKRSDNQEERDEYVVQDHLAPVRGEGKKLMRMVRVKSGGWAAETHFKRLEKLEKADLWEAKPLTGRTHQIRVHLAELRRPILGDFLYGGKSSEVPRLMLHARQLDFTHPVLKTPVSLKAPLPADFSTLLKKWQSRFTET